MLLTNDDIITSAQADFNLVVNLLNYYLHPDDVVYFYIDQARYTCRKSSDRTQIICKFYLDIEPGSYNYRMVIDRKGTLLTILVGKMQVSKSLKSYLIGLMHKIFRADPWLGELFDAAGIALAEVMAFLDVQEKNLFFDTASKARLMQYEKEAGLTMTGGQTESDRQSRLMAKWRGAEKCTLNALQNVADSWKNGIIRIGFANGHIYVTFISPIGVPQDLSGLKDALEEVKPAHLGMIFEFKYLTWGDAKNYGAWLQHKNKGSWLYVKQDKEE